jgi:hypothetical protein
MAKDFKIGPGGPTGAPPKVNITPEMMKGFKTLTCDCGGQLFQTGVVIKKISALVSPTGNEEMYPMEVLVCMNCHKVPNDTNTLNMLPEGVLAARSYVNGKPESPKTFEKPPFPSNGFVAKSPLSVVKDDGEKTKDELSKQ